MKKLSIIIPVYNCEKYIERCLKSIVNELDDEVELIVIDDGSKDQTPEICKKYTSKNVNIMINSNHGASYSRNIGIEKASGENIMFVDADDYLTEGWKNIVLDAIKEKKDIYYFNKNISNIEIDKTTILDYIFGIDKSIRWFATPWSKVFNRDFIKNNNIKFEEKIINGEDMLFNAIAISKCKSYSLIKANIYNYRICETSITNSFNEKLFESDMNFQKKLKEILKENNMDVKYSNHCIQNAIIIFTRKISMVDLNKMKNYFWIFESEPYKNQIKNATNLKNNKSKIIMNLLRKKKYMTAAIITKVFRRIKNKKTYDYMIEV